jgi:AcrR family transcriptional regulator
MGILLYFIRYPMNTEIKKKISIADAFEKHFRHFGFKKTTVDEVASELGVSKKTIYKNFSSKDEIFYFIITRKAEARRAMIDEKIRHLSSATEKMESMVRINFQEFRKVHKKKIKAMDDRFQAEIAAGAFREAFKRMVSDILTEGVENDEFEVCDHEMTVRYIQSLITETVKNLMENEESQPEEFLIFTLKKILVKAK